MGKELLWCNCGRAVGALPSGQLRGRVDLNCGIGGVRCIIGAPRDSGCGDLNYIQLRL